MKFRVATAGLSLLLGGCALPIPVQIATWALEGASVFTTHKTLGDHGLSAVAQKDCSLWRSLKGEDVCREEDGATAVAALTTATDAIEGDPAAPTYKSGDRALSAVPVASVALAPVAANPAAGTDTPVAAASTASDATPAAAPVLAAAETPAHAASVRADGFYYVIGSFSDRRNAEHLVVRHRDLTASVMPVQVGARTFYRVAVGPFAPDTAGETRTRLNGMGYSEAWLLRPTADWQVADKVASSARGS